MYKLNKTHDPKLKSWVVSANDHSDFPIQNLPFAIFRKSKGNQNFRVGVAIGDQIIDMSKAHELEIFPDLMEFSKVFTEDSLNSFMSLNKSTWSKVREVLSKSLADDISASNQDLIQRCFVRQNAVEYKVPANIGDYTDFYTSINHATNVGKLFRPDNPLLPNYQWIPIGYHGRSSSIEVSGHSFKRPNGQLKDPDLDAPVLKPCKRLDYELEVGIYVGKGNELGEPIRIDQAEDHVFGLCLFNDWSARDIQAWEYQPLGPFLSKSFASTVSPWIVTMEALAPYRTKWDRPIDQPQPLSYLDSDLHRETGGIDMKLEVLIETPKMRELQESPSKIASSNFKQSYWSVAQMLTHHTVNGCNMMAGDFFGSGTQSGTTMDSVGSLLEATHGGKQPITLANGEQRTFLEDGDSVILRGYCDSTGYSRIGFGEAIATVLPAIQY